MLRTLTIAAGLAAGLSVSALTCAHAELTPAQLTTQPADGVGQLVAPALAGAVLPQAPAAEQPFRVAGGMCTTTCRSVIQIPGGSGDDVGEDVDEG